MPAPNDARVTPALKFVYAPSNVTVSVVPAVPLDGVTDVSCGGGGVTRNRKVVLVNGTPIRRDGVQLDMSSQRPGARPELA